MSDATATKELGGGYTCNMPAEELDIFNRGSYSLWTREHSGTSTEADFFNCFSGHSRLVSEGNATVLELVGHDVSRFLIVMLWSRALLLRVFSRLQN